MCKIAETEIKLQSFLSDDAGGLLNDVPGIPGKKSKGKASEATAAVGGSNAGVDPSDNSSMHGKRQAPTMYNGVSDARTLIIDCVLCAAK